jgi:imidazolonepropionase-like amidohydrolase
LPADAALRALTLDAAQIFGVNDRLGSLETGKVANLVVVQGDLLGDKPVIKHVFVDGRRFDVPADAAPAGPAGPRGGAPRPGEGDRR